MAAILPVLIMIESLASARLTQKRDQLKSLFLRLLRCVSYEDAYCAGTASK